MAIASSRDIGPDGKPSVTMNFDNTAGGTYSSSNTYKGYQDSYKQNATSRDIGPDGKPSVTMNLGRFDPWQSKNKDRSFTRMAGDYLSEFTQQNPEAKEIIEKPKNSVMSVMGGSDNKKNEGSTKTNDTQSSSSGNASSGSSEMKPITPGYAFGQSPEEIAKSNEIADSQYAQNQKIIGNYSGITDIRNFDKNKKGTAAAQEINDYLGYQRAVSQNKKIDSNRASQASKAAGNDHGSGEYKAPQSKDYYSYLDSYDGPKSNEEVIRRTKQQTAGMGAAEKMSWEMEKGKAGERPGDIYDKWVKDSSAYKKAWG